MKQIVQMIIDMLENNIGYGTAGIGEKFTDWLEFDADNLEELKKENVDVFMTKETLEQIFEIAPYVDNLTNKLLEMWEKEEKKE